MPDRNDLPDVTDDQLRDTLRGLYNDALLHVMPPGVDRVRRGARRRTALQTTAGVVLVAVMVVVAFGQPWRLYGGSPVAPPTATSTPGPTATRPTPSASPTAPASTSAATSTELASGGSTGGGSSPTGCVPQGVVDVTELMNYGYTSVSVRVPAEHPDWSGLICPGERVRVFWASYTVDPGGVQHLYRSEERMLDLATPSWRMYIDMKWEGLCGPTWYVSKGSDGIPSTIPLGASAFPNKFHWDDDNAKPGCNPIPPGPS
jgi:hypothetical protein